MVSSMLFNEGEMLPTMNVKVFAVSESCKSLVNFDYLKAGMLFPPVDKL